MSELPPLESSAKTAIGAGSSGKGGTVGSYITADKLFSQQGGTKLDFGSGRGEGAKLIKADTYEPYVKSNPKYTTSGQIPSNSYDKITSLNVLNVIPPEQRKETVKEIARVLKPNGEAIISTRGKDVEAAKNKIKVKDGYVIGKGDQARFQKGFSVEELKKYVQKTLGKDFTVQPVKLGKAAVKITKGGAGMNPLKDKQFGFPKPELFDVADPTMKTNFNKGGVPTMANKNLESQQLELFGGLKDQGGMKDPATGNEVPVGSTKKEVRDDIPAQLSEGEFVLPSDVVRYHGLEKIMGLRDQAKSGLNKMEAMGQMGNSDEATLPDNTPFMANTGGVAGVNIQDPSELQKKQSIFQTRSPQGQQVQAPTVQAPTVQTPTVQTPPTPQETKPRTFKDTIGAKFGEVPKTEDRQYKNPETGEVMTIAFVNGEPITAIPAGFVPIEQAKDDKSDVVQDVLVPTTQVTKEDRDRPSASQVAGTGSFSLGNLNLGSLAGGAIGSIFGPFGSFMGSQIGGQLGQQGEVKPLTGDLGYGNLSAAKQAMGSYKILGDATATGRVGTGVGDTDVNTKGIFNNSFSVATDISDLSKYGGAMRDENGHTVYRTINEQVKSLKAAAKTGWFGGPLSPMEYHGLTSDNKMKYNNYATEAGFNEQNYGTGTGQELYNEFTNNLPKYNISGANQPLPTSVKNDDTGESGDGYLVSNGKAHKGTYVYNKTSGDMQFEKADGSGTIIAVSKDDGSPALVGDLTGSGSKTAQELAKKQAEENRKAIIAAQMKEEKRIREEQANEREARQERQKAKDEFRQDLKEQRNQGNISAQMRGGKAGGDMFRKGGLMTKPKKKKVMKRGGLASR